MLFGNSLGFGAAALDRAHARDRAVGMLQHIDHAAEDLAEPRGNLRLGEGADPGGAERAQPIGVGPHLPKQMLRRLAGRMIVTHDDMNVALAAERDFAHRAVKVRAVAVLHEQQLKEPRLFGSKFHPLHPAHLVGGHIVLRNLHVDIKARFRHLAHSLAQFIHIPKDRENRRRRGGQALSDLAGGQRIAPRLAHEFKRGGDNLFFCIFRFRRHNNSSCDPCCETVVIKHLLLL